MYNFISALQIRGGENILEELAKNYTDSGNPNCIVGKGLRYLNNLRLRTIVYYLFKAKAKNGVIYITQLALCQVVNMYGGLELLGLAVPIVIQDNVIGVSSWFHLTKKVISSLFLTAPLSMLVLINGYLSVVGSLTAVCAAIGMQYFIRDPGFVIIATDLISDSFDSIRRPILDQPDVVSVNLPPDRPGKINMPKFSKGYECSLPE
jgi:hypothetical protein